MARMRCRPTMLPAMKAGAVLANLGPTILRIETAAIVTAALVAATGSRALRD